MTELNLRSCYTPDLIFSKRLDLPGCVFLDRSSFLSITTLKSAWSEKEADFCFKVCLKSINHFEIDHDIASNPTRKSYTTTSLRKTELGSCSWSGFRSTITTQHRRFKRLRIRVRKTFFFNLKVFFKLRFYNF